MNEVSQSCPKCEGDMQQGFILDMTHRGRLVSHWRPGVPQRSDWTGTHDAPQDQVIPIGVFRCGSCGFLESYARDDFAAQ